MVVTSFQEAKGADIASATTITLGQGGNFFVVTGGTTINGIVTASWQAGSCVKLELPSGITVTHNSGAPGAGAVSILLSSGSDLTTTTACVLALVYDGANWMASIAFGSSGVVGTVTSVTATPPLFSSGGATPNITERGAIVSGSASTTAQNIGSLTSGTLEQTVAAGVATVAAFNGTTASVPFYAANGQLAQDNANLSYDSSGHGLTAHHLIVPNVDGSSIAIKLSQAAAQEIAKNGGLFAIGTTDDNALFLFTNNVTRLGIDSDGVVTIASLGTGFVKATGGVLGIDTTTYQPTITWPVATSILVSTGTATAPGADPFLTQDTSNHILSASNCVLINGLTDATNHNAFIIGGNANNSNRDKAQFYVGGGTVADSPDNTLFLISQNSGTSIPAGRTTGIWSTLRVENNGYNGVSSPTITEATTLYVDGAPTLSGATGAKNAVHVAGGNTRLDGGLQFTETGGPTLLTIAAIPDSNPDSTTLVRASGLATISGVASHTIKGAPTGRDYIYYDELTAGLITTIIGGNQWLATSGSGLLSAGEISYPLGKIVPNYAMIEAVVLGTNTFTAGKLVYTIMANGSSAAFSGGGGAITIDSTSTAGTVISSGVIPYSGSPATTDRIGVLVSAGGTVPAVSATLRVAVTVRISAVAF